MSKNVVFVVHHVRVKEDDEEDVKLIGVYSSEASAASAVRMLSAKPGFSDFLDGFHVEGYEMDATHWGDGFATMFDGNSLRSRPQQSRDEIGCSALIPECGDLVVTESVVELAASRVLFCSDNDETAFFEWLGRMRCVEGYEGRGDTICLRVNSLEITDGCLRDLIALFWRYGVSMRQLSVFDRKEFSPWFRSRDAYWYAKVWGAISK